MAHRCGLIAADSKPVSLRIVPILGAPEADTNREEPTRSGRSLTRLPDVREVPQTPGGRRVDWLGLQFKHRIFEFDSHHRSESRSFRRHTGQQGEQAGEPAARSNHACWRAV